MQTKKLYAISIALLLSAGHTFGMDKALEVLKENKTAVITGVGGLVFGLSTLFLGHRKGKKTGQAQGYDQGYDQGQAQGQAQGYDQGQAKEKNEVSDKVMGKILQLEKESRDNAKYIPGLEGIKVQQKLFEMKYKVNFILDGKKEEIKKSEEIDIDPEKETSAFRFQDMDLQYDWETKLVAVATVEKYEEESQKTLKQLTEALKKAKKGHKKYKARCKSFKARLTSMRSLFKITPEDDFELSDDEEEEEGEVAKMPFEENVLISTLEISVPLARGTNLSSSSGASSSINLGDSAGTTEVIEQKE